MVRRYSNFAVETTLDTGIGSGDSGLVVVDAAGYPAPPFVIALEPDTAFEEFILVGQKSSATFSTLTRGFDGSTAGPHNAGSVVKHVAVASDFAEIWSHRHVSLEGSTPLDFGSPSDSEPGDINSDGIDTLPSRSDHVHGREAGVASVGVSLGRSVGDLAVPSSTQVDIPWQTEEWDVGGFHAANAPEVVIPSGLGGKYLMMFQLQIYTPANASPGIGIWATETWINGSKVDTSQLQVQQDVDFPLLRSHNKSQMYSLADGDSFKLSIVQAVGVGCIIREAATSKNHFQLSRLGL